MISRRREKATAMCGYHIVPGANLLTFNDSFIF